MAKKKTSKKKVAKSGDVLAKFIESRKDRHKKAKRKIVGSIRRLNEFEEMERIPSGSYLLDIALGGKIGKGFVKGKIIEIYGKEGAGKTTLCLKCIALNQQNGSYAIFDDAENKLNQKWAETLQVNYENLLLNESKSGEESIDDAREAMEFDSEGLDLYILDSITALLSSKISGFQGNINKVGEKSAAGGGMIGNHALMISDGLRKLVNSSVGKKLTIIFTNQLRTNVGQMFGNPEGSTGGLAIKFYASMRVNITKGKYFKKSLAELVSMSPEVVGKYIKAKIVKNNGYKEGNVVNIPLLFKTGIDNELELIIIGINCGIIEKHTKTSKIGEGYVYKETLMGIDQITAAEFLKSNEDMRNSIIEDINNSPLSIEAKIGEVKEEIEDQIDEMLSPIKEDE